jgi:hypothetical protein
MYTRALKKKIIIIINKYKKNLKVPTYCNPSKFFNVILLTFSITLFNFLLVKEKKVSVFLISFNTELIKNTNTKRDRKIY